MCLLKTCVLLYVFREWNRLYLLFTFGSTASTMATLVQDATENIIACELGSGYFVLNVSLKLKIVDCTADC